MSGFIGESLLSISGWKIEGTLPNQAKLVIAVGPHTSNWDFFLGIAVLFALRIRIKFLGKHSIFVPIVASILRRLGGIPVDRRSPHGVVEQVKRLFEQQAQMILALSPEGTRSPIFPWKSGFLNIASKAKVPILLIGFDFRYKKIRIGPLFESSQDTLADMQKVYDFFSQIEGKHPHKSIYSDPA